MQEEESSSSELKAVAAGLVGHRFSDKGWVEKKVNLPKEMDLTISVNQQELATILCTPIELKYLVFGFLYAAGIISGVGDVMMMRVCDDDPLADVRLSSSEFSMPTKRTITSGCGGGTIFDTKGQEVESSLVIAPTEVLALMKQFQAKMELYPLSGGVHTSALSDAREMLVVAEDIGRHNTLDKIQGECLLREISTRDSLLLTTGRISSEMLLKVASMQTPVVVSRHSPTDRAVSLAWDLGITLVGHVRGRSLMVYSHPERLGRSA